MMKRISGFLLASSLAIVLLSSPARAQQYIAPGTGYDLDGDGFVDGSFGGNYVQQPPMGIPGNRWNMLSAVPDPNLATYPQAYVEGDVVSSDGTAVQPRAFVGPPQAAVVQRPRTVVVRRGLLGRRRVYAQDFGGPAPYQNALPQTRIYGDGSIMAPNGYSTTNRWQTYGQGYGLGPYGSNYYSQYYQGRPLNTAP